MLVSILETNMDRLDSLRSLIHVARTSSFSKTARALGVSRSQVSKQIKNLEDRLQVRLLERTTQRVRLTDAGQSYVEACSRVVEELDDADRALANVSGAPRGDLRILAPRSFGGTYLSKAIHEFGAKYPDIRIALVLQDFSQTIAIGDFDVALRVGDIIPSSLIKRTLFESHWVVCAAPTYLAKHGAPKHPADLERHNCLVHLIVSANHVWDFTKATRRVSVHVNGSPRANSSSVLRDAALRGQGLALLPTYLVGDDIQSGALRMLFSDYKTLSLPVHVLFASKKYPPLKVRCFVDFLVSYCRLSKHAIL